MNTPMKTDVYNLKNEKVGKMDLPEGVFNVPWKPALVKQVLDAQLANKRKPWAHAKDRSEVRGGGKKPWRQKGTGRARHGSIRSPLWIGGGKAHGPRKEKDYSQKVNKKMKRGALFSALSKKLKEGGIRIIDSLKIEAPKTKILAKSIAAFIKPAKRSGKIDLLMIPDTENKTIYRAAANLPKTKVLNPISLNVYDILNYKNIFIDQNAVGTIEKHYAVK